MAENKKFVELKGEQVAKENPNLTPAEAFAMGWVEARNACKGLITDVIVWPNQQMKIQAGILAGGIGESREFYPDSTGKLVRREF